MAGYGDESSDTPLIAFVKALARRQARLDAAEETKGRKDMTEISEQQARNQEAYNQGQIGPRVGKKLHDNPYDKADERYSIWAEAFIEAKTAHDAGEGN